MKKKGQAMALGVLGLVALVVVFGGFAVMSMERQEPEPAAEPGAEWEAIVEVEPSGNRLDVNETDITEDEESLGVVATTTYDEFETVPSGSTHDLGVGVEVDGWNTFLADVEIEGELDEALDTDDVQFVDAWVLPNDEDRDIDNAMYVAAEVDDDEFLIHIDELSTETYDEYVIVVEVEAINPGNLEADDDQDFYSVEVTGETEEDIGEFDFDVQYGAVSA